MKNEIYFCRFCNTLCLSFALNHFKCFACNQQFYHKTRTKLIELWVFPYKNAYVEITYTPGKDDIDIMFISGKTITHPFSSFEDTKILIQKLEKLILLL